MQFDTILKNGHIYDGTGNPWRLMDIGITGDHIIEISKTDQANAKK